MAHERSAGRERERALKKGLLTVAVFATAIVCLILTFLWRFEASFQPKKLGTGEFLPTFHKSLESALPVTLPVSTNFSNAILFHAAGDVDVWIAARVPSQEIHILKNQFGELDDTYSYMLFAGAKKVMNRTLDYADVEFAGASQWGECAILPSENGWHEVLFHTSDDRRDQGGSSHQLYRHFR